MYQKNRFSNEVLQKCGVVEWKKRFVRYKYLKKVISFNNQNRYNFFKELNDELKKNNIFFFCCWGTALGFYRNRNFISYDDNIDIAVSYNFNDKFLIKNLQKKGTIVIKRKKKIMCYKDGLKIQLLRYKKKNKKFALLDGKFSLSEFKRKKFYIFNTYTYVPKNFKKHILECYGKNYYLKIRPAYESKYRFSENVDFLSLNYIKIKRDQILSFLKLQ